MHAGITTSVSACGHYHMTAMTSTCSDSCTHVGPPLGYSSPLVCLFVHSHTHSCVTAFCNCL